MGLRIPEEPVRTLKGIAAVVADGVSSAEAGREAAELCVQSFLSDCYSTPDSWSVRHSARVVLTALNRWLYAKSHATQLGAQGYLSTLSALVLKSHTAYLFHVGDSRIYRIRGRRIERLTRDHVAGIGEHKHFLSRAVGMAADLGVDYREVGLRAGDCFVLTTDGIHDFLSDEELCGAVLEGLEGGGPFETRCRGLLERARSAGSDDNLTCQLLRIDAIAPAQRDELLRELTRLPFPPPLAPGMRLDGYQVERELHASARSQIHLVRSEEGGELLAMKTPSLNFEDDPAYIERFVMESWIGGRIDHPNVVRVVSSPCPPTALYYLMEYIEGGTLAEWRDGRRGVGVREVVSLMEQVAAGLRAFERLEMIHQDLRPQNVLIDAEGRARIVDFGSCWVAGIQEIAAPISRDAVLGTARYTAPECRWGETAGIRSELFSLGTLAYELLTGHLPYGEAFERCRSPRDFSRICYTPSHQHDPMIPTWIDAAIQKAVALSPDARYESLSEFLHALKEPSALRLSEGHRPLVERDPVRFWRGVAGVLLLAELLTLWWLLR